MSGKGLAAAYRQWRFRRARVDQRLDDTIAALEESYHGLAEQLADQSVELRQLEETIAAGPDRREPDPRNSGPRQPDAPKPAETRTVRQWLRDLLIGAVHVTTLLAVTAASAILASIVLVGIYSAHHGGLSTFAAANLAAAAAGAAGLFAGFLFGVPHYNAKDIAQQATAHHETYIPSTNLEQVADWLTKILLGAGLVQIGSLYRGFGHMVAVIAAGFATTGPALAEAKLFTGGLLVFTFTLGFPLGYVVTTLWFVNKLGRPERS